MVIDNKNNYDISIDINYIEKMLLYTSHNMAHATAFKAKTPFYIL